MATFFNRRLADRGYIGYTQGKSERMQGQSETFIASLPAKATISIWTHASLAVSPASPSLEGWLLQALADEASEARTSTIDIRTSAESSLLASLWQKAIRRGQMEWAVMAALELHQRNPAYVWRRMRVIALEEVSVGDLGLVARVLAIAGKQALRARLGERQLLVHLTRELSRSRKCRTPCDMASWLDPLGEAGEETRLPGRTADFVGGDMEVIRRSAQAWRDAVPISMRVNGRWTSSGQGSRYRRDAFLEWIDAPPLLRFIVERGSGTYALNTLCAPTAQLKALGSMTRPPVMPLECSDELIAGIPAYAYCMYSMQGREAQRQFLKRTRWAEDERIRDTRQALNVLGNLVFYVEGGYCAEVLDVARGGEIERASEQTLLERLGIRSDDIPSLKESVREALPLLNDMRRLVARGV